MLLIFLGNSAVTRRYCRYFELKISAMDELFEASFSPLADTGKPMSRCAHCGRFMKYIAAKPARLYCPTCDTTYSLPNNGKIMLFKELKCPLDGFELLLFSTGSKGTAVGVGSLAASRL
jgi:DNA topoisomerase-3